MGDNSLICWKCGASLEDVPRPITRHSNCPACYAELHCCVMCKSFDTRYPNRCSDERADPPVHKDSANFCEFFKPRPGAYHAAEDRAGKQARAELGALFGEENGREPERDEKEEAGNDSPSETEKARRELEDLFKK